VEKVGMDGGKFIFFYLYSFPKRGFSFWATNFERLRGPLKSLLYLFIN